MKRIEFWLALALLTLCVWPAIDSSLWLDEAGSWWIVRDGLGEAVSRALSWSASSPFYYGVLWAAVQLFGLTELGLRIPSVIFSVATAVVLYRLGRRWFDAQGALIGVVLLLCITAVQFTVVDARPYALGLLLLVSAWLAMVNWVESRRWTRGLVFVVCAAAVVWVHYTLAAGLLPLVWYVPRLGWRRALTAAAGVALLVLPLATQILDTMARREVLSWARRPTVPEFVVSLGVVFLIPLVIFWAVGKSGRSTRARRESVPGAPEQSPVPFVLLALIPPVLMFVISSAGLMQLFVPRYIVSKEVGLAMVGAWLIMQMPDPKLRSVAVLVQVVLSLALTWPAMGRHGGEDWRGSSAWVRAEVDAHPQTRVVLLSGFVESLRAGYLEDPRYRDILMAPQLVYPVPGEPIMLPWMLNETAERRLRSHVVPAAEQAKRIAVVSLAMGQSYEQRLQETLRAAGLQIVETRRFGAVRGLLFEAISNAGS